MSKDNFGNKQTIIKHKLLVNDEKYDLVITPHRQSETTAIHEINNLKDSKNKNHQTDDQLYFTDSETTSPASVKSKRKRKKNCYTNKPIRFYNWNRPIKHIECYTLTVIQYKIDSK